AMATNAGNTVSILDMATGKERRRLQGNAGELLAPLLLSSDGRIAVTISYSKENPNNRTITFWNAEAGRVVHTIPDTAANRAEELAFNRDGTVFYTATSGFTVSGRPTISVTVHEVVSGKVLRIFGGALHPSQNDSSHDLYVSPNERVLAIVSPKKVGIWDIASGKQLRILPHAASAVLAVAFSPDGATLATGDSEGAIRLWDVASGKPLRAFKADVQMITALRFHP